jgi:hypothetical protein
LQNGSNIICKLYFLFWFLIMCILYTCIFFCTKMKWFYSPLSSHLIEELVSSYLIMFISIYDSVIYLFSLNVALCFIACPLPSLSQGVTFRYSVLRSVVINLAVVPRCISISVPSLRNLLKRYPLCTCTGHSLLKTNQRWITSQ